MGCSSLVGTNNNHATLAESGQRLRMVEVRDRIYEAKILDLTIAMAQTGLDLTINRETMKLEGTEPLAPDVRQKYMLILVHKLISNAVAPKELTGTTASKAAEWVGDLESPATPAPPTRAKMQHGPT